MADPITHTQYDDAPLSTAKNPEPGATGDPRASSGDSLIGRTVTINRPRADLYAFWRNFSNLPRFMVDIERITVVDDRRSHWVVRAPAGETVEWDALVTEDVSNESIAWQSAEGAKIRNSGRVDFRDAPGGRGTQVSVTLLYHPPGGMLGKLVAKLYQKEPNIQVRRELRRFKQLMETGEISTARAPDAAPRG